MTVKLSGLTDLLAWAEQQKSAVAAPALSIAPRMDQPAKALVPPGPVLDAAAQSGCAPTGDMGRQLAADLFVWALNCPGDSPEVWSRLYLSAQDGSQLRAIRLPAPPGVDDAVFKPRPRGHSSDPRRLAQFPWDSLCGLDVEWVWTGSTYVVSSAADILDCKGVVNRPSLYVTMEKAVP
jgi:hypothetical protein